MTEAKVIRANGRRAILVARTSYPSAKFEPDSLAFIQHSAGTTGLQKGVALTHAAVLTQLEHLVQVLQIDGTTDRIYSWLPLYHDMGLIACFMLPMVCHVPIVMQSPLDWVMHPETMLQIIDEYKCTLSWLPNFAFQFVPRRTRQRPRPQYDLSSVRALINCSEPVRHSSMREFHDAFAPMGLRAGALQSSYAMAENVFAVTQSDIDSPIRASNAYGRMANDIAANTASRRVAEGTRELSRSLRPGGLLPNHEVRIVSDSGAALPDGQVGEILVKSDCLFRATTIVLT